MLSLDNIQILQKLVNRETLGKASLESIRLNWQSINSPVDIYYDSCGRIDRYFVVIDRIDRFLLVAVAESIDTAVVIRCSTY